MNITDHTTLRRWAHRRRGLIAIYCIGLIVIALQLRSIL